MTGVPTAGESIKRPFIASGVACESAGVRHNEDSYSDDCLALGVGLLLVRPNDDKNRLRGEGSSWYRCSAVARGLPDPVERKRGVWCTEGVDEWLRAVPLSKSSSRCVARPCGFDGL